MNNSTTVAGLYNPQKCAEAALAAPPKQVPATTGSVVFKTGRSGVPVHTTGITSDDVGKGFWSLIGGLGYRITVPTSNVDYHDCRQLAEYFTALADNLKARGVKP